VAEQLDEFSLGDPYHHVTVGRDEPFSPSKLFAFPDDELANAERTMKAGHSLLKKDHSICVIGGGIAGLVAAYELATRSGCRVRLVEASDRLGGRIRTHRFDAENYGELGAMRIPQEHLGVHHYIQHFNVGTSAERDIGTREFFMKNPRGLYFFSDVHSRIDAWQALSERFKIPAPLSDVSPGDFISNLMKDFPPRKGALWHAFCSERTHASDSEAARVEDLDRYTVWQAFCNDHVHNKLFDPVYSQETADSGGRDHGAGGSQQPTPHIGALSDGEWEYFGRTSGTLWVERGTLLQFLLELPQSRGAASMREVRGGLGLLIDAFEKALRALSNVEIDLNTRVRAVAAKRSGQVKVETTSAFKGRCSETFDLIICAVPAKATVDIDWWDGFPSQKLYALSNLTYESLAKCLVSYSTRWWELNERPRRGTADLPRFDVDGWDPIVGGSSHTDLSIQQCWYPSDNAKRLRDGQLTRRSERISRGPGVLTLYMWGHNARRFAALSGADREEQVQADIEKLHYASESQHRPLINDIAHFAWDVVAHPLGGAITYFGPGERQRYQQELCTPVRAGGRSRPVVYLAGEHLGVVHGWVQSAVSSALSAVLRVLSAQ
jgi:monoamine oxidase